MGDGIPINKGNYDMETQERLEQYEANRGWGWEEAYNEYRKNWREYPQRQYVSEYPLLVDVELSTICNLSCPMCYTVTDEFKSRVCCKFMDIELFKKIIDEIAGKVPAVRLSLRGEATLHPDFVSCIQYCKSKGIEEVSFLTNASKLSEDFFIQIAEAGADWITISVDGIGNRYEEIRKPLRFEETYQKIKKIHDIKKQNNWKRPVIKIQAIWPAIRDDPSEYYNTFAPYVDLVAFNPLIDFVHKEGDAIYEKEFSCPQLYQRLVIGSDGKALACANDEDGKYIVGDANFDSVYHIWHGESLEKARELHRKGKFKEIEICRECYLPRATEDSEHAFVDGREIVIKNYACNGHGSLGND